ncbi:hypothetical protein ISO31_12915 [Staphylococcus haemolyticus]|nr:hypothetical protein [Staphylococcus haemolyticus]
MYSTLQQNPKKNILGQYATLDKFLEAWHTNGNKQKLLGKMEQNGIFYQEIINDEKLTDMDPFDLIVYLAYNQKPLSKSERVAHLKKSGLLDKYQGAAREILETLLTMYQNDGIQELENNQVLSLPEFERYGGPFKIIVNLFGGKEQYQDAVFELKEKIYN